MTRFPFFHYSIVLVVWLYTTYQRYSITSFIL
nr:MAG TPA: hypothetical protein [Caudoviricetes sp.]